MSVPTTFRLATSSDLPSIRALIPPSVRVLSAGLYSAAQIESALVHVFGADTQLITDETYFVAECDGAIVGCGGWSKRRTIYGGDQMKSGEDPLLDPQIDAARIRAFFIHPHYARQGIGSGILGKCVEGAGEAGFNQLELVGTLPGERLYAKYGFEVVERIPTMLPDGIEIEFVRMRATIARVTERLNKA